MKITRIYTNEEGHSCFGEVDIPLKEAGSIGSLSDLFNVTGIIFRETPGDYDYLWHNAPRRQYLINLEGEVDCTVYGGETRRFGPGDVVLLEDIYGDGHCSKAVNGQSRKSIFVTLD